MWTHRIALLMVATALPLVGAKAPKPGISIEKIERAHLDSETRKLEATIATIKDSVQLTYLPDVLIFYNAVRYALDHNMFYKPSDVATAKKLLLIGKERADMLKDGKHPWTAATGLVVRGYLSRLDGSVQPYGLVVPNGYSPRLNKRWRLDIWLHGHNNQLSEIRFLGERLKNKGQFTPKDTMVLHPYGRFCNAYKFAGEVDVLEALHHVQSRYSIDRQRVALRGFSMGGAGAWHLGAHYTGDWAAVAPGAGFVDTAIYQGIWERAPQPTWWEQKLWRLYDVPPIAANFANTTTIAYSGEIDKQRQAADLMTVAFKKEGVMMAHIIGPKTGHRYEPKSKLAVARLVDAAAEKGNNFYARKVRFTTYTLRQNRMKWVSLHGLEKHWKQARVEAEYVDDWKFIVKTKNVSALMLEQLKESDQGTTKYMVTIDGQKLSTKPLCNTGIKLRKFDGKWNVMPSLQMNALVKLSGLQGPIKRCVSRSFYHCASHG